VSDPAIGRPRLRVDGHEELAGLTRFARRVPPVEAILVEVTEACRRRAA
jgi:hypothetical protein